MIRELRILLFVLVEFRSPCGASLSSALSDAIFEMVVDAIGNKKLCILRPAVVSLHEFHFRFAEGLAVRVGTILLVGRSVADVAIDHDKCRTVLRLQQSLLTTPTHSP